MGIIDELLTTAAGNFEDFLSLGDEGSMTLVCGVWTWINLMQPRMLPKEECTNKDSAWPRAPVDLNLQMEAKFLDSGI